MCLLSRASLLLYVFVFCSISFYLSPVLSNPDQHPSTETGPPNSDIQTPPSDIPSDMVKPTILTEKISSSEKRDLTFRSTHTTQSHACDLEAEVKCPFDSAIANSIDDTATGKAPGQGDCDSLCAELTALLEKSQATKLASLPRDQLILELYNIIKTPSSPSASGQILQGQEFMNKFTNEDMVKCSQHCIDLLVPHNLKDPKGPDDVPYGEIVGIAPGNITAYSNGNDMYFSGEEHWRNGIYLGIKWQCVEFSRRYLLDRRGLYFGDIPAACQMLTNLTYVRRLRATPDTNTGASSSGDGIVDRDPFYPDRLPVTPRNNGHTSPPPRDSLLIWPCSVPNPFGHVAAITKMIFFPSSEVRDYLIPSKTIEKTLGLAKYLSPPPPDSDTDSLSLNSNPDPTDATEASRSSLNSQGPSQSASRESFLGLDSITDSLASSETEPIGGENLSNLMPKVRQVGNVRIGEENYYFKRWVADYARELPLLECQGRYFVEDKYDYIEGWLEFPQ